MLIFPAIDLFEQKAVRLLKGDYQNMTVYSNSPLTVARDFALCGAEWIHMVDLEGAKFGSTPNFEVVRSVCENTDLKLEIGGGIRDIKTVSAYLSCGVRRVILGTAAVTDPHFLEEAVERYGDKIAVGVDLKDGLVAIKGWTEVSDQSAFSFCERMQKIGVSTLICTDISKDGNQRWAVPRNERAVFASYHCFGRCFYHGGRQTAERIGSVRCYYRKSLLHRGH